MTPSTITSARGKRTLPQTESFHEFAKRVGLTHRQFLILLIAKYIGSNLAGDYIPKAGFEKYFVRESGELRLNSHGIRFFLRRYDMDAVAASWMRKEDE